GWCAYTSHNTPSPEFHAHRRPVIRIASALRRHTWHGRRPRCLRLGRHTFSGGRREAAEFQGGRRVIVRYTLDPGVTHLTSATIVLVTAVDEAGVEIDTKRGPLLIPRSQILLVHEVPPAPTRTGRTHEIVSAVDLRRISAAAWLPQDVSWLHVENLRNEGT